MKEIALEARARKSSGKGAARKLRAGGKIPGIVYGRGEEPLALEIDHISLHNAMRGSTGENLLINLNIDGIDSGKKAIIKDMQRDPVDGHLLHIDFMHISMTEKIRVTVPIVLEGTPDGVKNFGGIMSWVIRHVDVSCLPKDIPDKISLDVSNLKIHDSIHVRDIGLGDIEILENPDKTVVSIVPPTVVKEEVPVAAEGEEAAEAAPEAEEAGEPEVISEKKSEERQAEKGKGEKGKGEEKK